MKKINDLIEKLHVRKSVKLIAIFIMIAIAVISIFGEHTDIYQFKDSDNLFINAFTQVIGDEEIYLDDMSNFQDVEPGETLVLTNIVPEINSEKVLFFYTKDVEVWVYADGELIYSFEMQENFEFLETPGNKWNGIEISQDMIGQTITIELKSNFEDKFDSVIPNIYLIDDGEALNVVLTNEGIRLILSFVLFAMTFYIYANAFIWKRKSLKKYFICLARFYLCTALWLLSTFSAFNHIFHSPIFSYLVSMFMVLLIPAVAFDYIKYVYKKKIIAIKFIEMLAWGNVVLQLVLQFVFNISLLTLLPLSYLVYGGGSIFCIILIVHHIYANRRKSNYSLISLLIILVGVVCEVAVLCLFPERTDLIGACSICALMIYLIVNHFNILKMESNIDMERVELEEHYHKLQSTSLMQQIKSHFFFNTLNTISSLCKYDAKEADRAISVFAQYMRSHMKLVSSQENIDFEEELEIVQASLEIERMRFPDNFSYQIDLEYINFKVPPLTIQPIVENSMIHGLRRAGKVGEIDISTKDCGDHIEIIISDNGVGFDTNSLIEHDSVGLTNLEKRLKLMIGGEMRIESEFDVGTKTTLIIPKKS